MTWGRAYTGLARGDVQNYTKSMLVLVQYGLLVCTAHLSGVLVGTVLKCIASLAFVILLIFVVRRSEHILKVVTIFLCALPAKKQASRGVPLVGNEPRRRFSSCNLTRNSLRSSNGHRLSSDLLHLLTRSHSRALRKCGVLLRVRAAQDLAGLLKKEDLLPCASSNS